MTLSTFVWVDIGSWMSRGACTDTTSEGQDAGASWDHDATPAAQALAVAICGRCTVRTECARWAGYVEFSGIAAGHRWEDGQIVGHKRSRTS